MSSQLYALTPSRVQIFDIVKTDRNDLGYNEQTVQPSKIETEACQFFFTKQELIDYVNRLPELS